MESDFEPRILGFLCNWCAYAGADLAGVSRIPYAPNLRVIRVMCSGRVDPIFILDAFLNGMDGVIIGGCHLGECHYLTGNYAALKVINMTRKILGHVGITNQRLLLKWISAAEGVEFARAINSFTAQIKELGPLGVSENQGKEELRFKLRAARLAMGKKKLRQILNKLPSVASEGSGYDNTQGKTERFDGQIIDELVANEVLLLFEESLSVEEIGERLDLPRDEVLRHIASLRKKGLVALDAIRGSSPLYTSRIEGA